MDKDSSIRANARFGYWVALATGVATTIAFGVAIATPPLSGPFCVQGCFRYPYHDVAQRFPRDYYWMLPAIVATLLYVAFMAAWHVHVRVGLQAVSLTGLLLAGMAGVTLVSDYYLQLAVVQPSLLANEADGIALLSQYNPHGVFIALEELGYVLMSLSLAVSGSTLPRDTWLTRGLRLLFMGGCAATAIAVALFAWRYGHARAYLLEVALISIDWLVLIVGTFSMSVYFRRELMLTNEPGTGA